MHADDPTLDPSLRLEALTREYSRFSRSAGGLSAVAGGIACLASWLAGSLLPTTPALRVALIALPLAWLLGKQWLAFAYYQRFGQVTERPTTSERRYHLFFTGFTAFVSLQILLVVLGDLAPFGARPWDAAAAGYLAVVVALPIVVWRWLRTPLEFIVGVFLCCQAAVAFAGLTYKIGLGTIVFPIAAVLLIVVGLRDHRRFLQLQRELPRAPDGNDE
jgi:hypothetical protein